MKKRSEIKATFNFEEEKDIAVNDLNKVLGNFEQVIDESEQGLKEFYNDIAASQLLYSGSNNCCLQLCFIIEAEVNDSKVKRFESYINDINKIINYVNNPELEINHTVEALSKRTKLVNAIDKCLKDIKLLPDLNNFSLKIDEYHDFIEYSQNDIIKYKSEQEEVKVRIEHFVDKKITVYPLQPYLSKGLNKKWKIYFEPLFGKKQKTLVTKSEFTAIMGDDDYVEKSIVILNEAFSSRDTLICDVEYDITWKGARKGFVKNIKIIKVYKHVKNE